MVAMAPHRPLLEGIARRTSSLRRCAGCRPLHTPWVSLPASRRGRRDLRVGHWDRRDPQVGHGWDRPGLRSGHRARVRVCHGSIVSPAGAKREAAEEAGGGEHHERQPPEGQVEAIDRTGVCSHTSAVREIGASPAPCRRWTLQLLGHADQLGRQRRRTCRQFGWSPPRRPALLPPCVGSYGGRYGRARRACSRDVTRADGRSVGRGRLHLALPHTVHRAPARFDLLQRGRWG